MKSILAAITLAISFVATSAQAQILPNQEIELLKSTTRQGVLESSQYDWVNPKTLANFPVETVEETRTIKFVVVEMPKGTSDADAFVSIQKKRLSERLNH